MAISAMLANSLKPFEKYFKGKDSKGVKEISINKPGEIWIETYDGWTRKKDPAFTLDSLNTFAKHLATEQGQKFSESVPFLATSIPPYGFRIMAVGGSAADSGFLCSIRVAQAQRFDVQNYFQGRKLASHQDEKFTFKGTKKDAATLIKAIEESKTILVSGGTGSGKTTLLNSLIRYIPDWQRIGIIEDTKELVVDQPNSFRLLKSKTDSGVGSVTYKNLLDAAMRLRPDRIALGELDTTNTSLFLRLANTGHGGSFCTVHADDPGRALDAIVSNVMMTSQANEKYVYQAAKDAIDIIVQIANDRVNNTYDAMCVNVDDL